MYIAGGQNSQKTKISITKVSDDKSFSALFVSRSFFNLRKGGDEAATVIFTLLCPAVGWGKKPRIRLWLYFIFPHSSLNHQKFVWLHCKQIHLMLFSCCFL